jgi:peptidoglycan/LPS O-acetylase OafA/YrhL
VARSIELTNVLLLDRECEWPRALYARQGALLSRAVLELPRPVQLRRSATYFPEVESLRGIAIVLVVLFHAATFGRPLLGRHVSPALAFLYAGHTGVTLFFVLSAFLLSLPFLAAAAGGRPVRVRDFFRRRALRILPLYWTAVVVATVRTAHHPQDLARGLPFLVFLNNFISWSPRPYGNVWWSLVTEVQFYLVLPLLPLALRSRRGRLIGAAALASWTFVYAAFLVNRIHFPSPDAQLHFAQGVFGRAPAFMSGLGAAWLYLHYGDALRARLARHAWLRRGGADVLLLATLTLLGLVLRHFVYVGPNQGEAAPTHILHAVESALWAAILLVLLLAPIRAKPLVSNPVLGALGLISYSLYLVHLPLTWFTMMPFASPRGGRLVGWDIPTVLVIARIFVTCVAISTLTYWVIERPFLVRKARVDVGPGREVPLRGTQRPPTTAS